MAICGHLSENRQQSTDDYSNASGFRPISLSPAAFFSQYFRTQASQLFPAAVSRPVNARPAILEYGIATLPEPSCGITRTTDSASVDPLRRSKTYPSTREPSLSLMVTSPR